MTPGKTKLMAPLLSSLSIEVGPRLTALRGGYLHIKKAFTILKGLLPLHDAWIAHQVLSTVMGGFGGEGREERKVCLQDVGMRRELVGQGRVSWLRVLQDPRLHSMYQSKRNVRSDAKGYKPKVVVKELWKGHTQASPCKGDIIIDHVSTGHTRPIDPVTKKRKRCCPDDPNEPGKKLCKEEAIHWMEKSMREIYDEAMKDPYLIANGIEPGAVSFTFFKDNRPKCVKHPTLRTCACKSHMRYKHLLADLRSGGLWRRAHSKCGGDGGGGCSSEEMCASGGCRDVFNSGGGLLNMLLCNGIDVVGEGVVGTGHKWACVSGGCSDCMYGTRAKPREPDIVSCPQLSELIQTMEEAIRRREEDALGPFMDGAEGDDGMDVDGMTAPIKLCIRKYVKRSQEQEEGEHEPQWRAVDVGGQEGGVKARPKEAEVLEPVEMTIEEAKAYMKEVLIDYVQHQNVALHQSRAFQQCKQSLREGDIMLVADFSMNWKHTHQVS